MSYIKANDILPQELLEIIQSYIDGEYIYIPRKECNKKNWGENTETKREITIRVVIEIRINRRWNNETCCFVGYTWQFNCI